MTERHLLEGEVILKYHALAKVRFAFRHHFAANKTDGAEAGTIMVQAAERHSSLESFIADKAYKRQARQVA